MTEHAVLAFIVASTLLTISPGADTFLVLRNALRGGVVDGWSSTFGVCCGLFLHAGLSAIGISLILLQSPGLFILLQLAGAGYLIYLGAVTLQTLWQTDAGERMSVNRISTGGLVRAFREGLLSNVLNPKPIVFYMAFLPQFIDPAGSALKQSLFLALIHFGISMIWLGMVAILASRMRAWLTSGKIRRRLDGLLGATLVGFGFVLAIQVSQQD